MAVTASLVKELRERTGAGMMDCKKALVETNGDIEQAIENMRKSGLAKAAKKAGRVAAEGTLIIKQADGVAAMVEVNCETDFVAMDASFQAMANEIGDIALAGKITDIEALRAAPMRDSDVETIRAQLVAKIGENMAVRRVQIVEGDNLGAYIHGRKIGVVSVLNGGDEELAKDIAMHIAACSPQFVKPEDVSAEVVAKEREIQVEIAMNSGKPKEIAEKMVEGRMRKFTGEISLTGQAFVKDPSKTVGQLLKEKGADVVNFVRLEVGEGIEKEEVDFAAEVAAQVAAAKQ
ncbi:translation elongation factor Ts [Ferrimonas marina]|uniref:Elongation factor Ts n=1 Tax=Ferrimonas marina TaxID=299255 RepID=A0A1M5YFE6_9GAMM|nr:translation elongation factor Ts [Ferrimonas marina]SHI10791.1 elongation factor Ts [Ferrimonas marina]